MSVLSDLFSAGRRRTIVAGASLFLRDQPVTQMHWLSAGSIALERPLTDGTQLTLHTALPGTLLAEASLFSECYHCDGVARESSEVASTDRDEFIEALRADPDILMVLLGRQAGDIQHQRTRIEIIRMRRLSDRLDAWLEFYGPPALGGWKGVADTIGVTPAALYRELAKRRG